MKLNTDKCLFLVSGIKYERNWAKIDDKIWESNKSKLLGVAINNKLKSHIANICFNANQELNILRSWLSC